MFKRKDKKKHENEADPEHPEAPPQEEPNHEEGGEEHHDEGHEIDPHVKELLDGAAADKHLLQTNTPYYRKYVVTNGDQIAYSFSIKKKGKVSFSIIFVPETMSSGSELDNDKELKKFVVKKDKEIDHGADIFTAEGRGTVVFRWANPSWIMVRELVVYMKIKQADLAEIAIENARRDVEERHRHSADLTVEESKRDDDEESDGFH